MAYTRLVSTLALCTVERESSDTVTLLPQGKFVQPWRWVESSGKKKWPLQTVSQNMASHEIGHMSEFTSFYAQNHNHMMHKEIRLH